MTSTAHGRIPTHLRRYIVDQYYARYTAEDQAVWRYVMRQLRNFLGTHAHPSYLPGLQKTGIETEQIPRIERVDEYLEKLGWGAVPVSGFIPPAAFMEFQSIGILPIACDMRSADHLQYTPAPDIVHEAAGHAPILINPDYAGYLRQYGEVARHAIITKEDVDQYEAIRTLSDVKEDPQSTATDIARAEKNLLSVNQAMTQVSEAALLSRMNWWTAEYGLIGSLREPKIFGAGLLSSVGESRLCLHPKVKKIPLTVDCVHFSYDITEQQPQLFVAESFAQLGQVLEDLASRLSYRRGGVFGLERAVEAKAVTTVQLNSGIQISGILQKFLRYGDNDAAYLHFAGASQLSYERNQLAGQGPDRHQHGFSCPIGLLKNHRRCLSHASPSDLKNMALKRGERTRLQFESGVCLEGLLKDFIYENNRLIVLTWQDCRVVRQDTLLFDPSWGEYDMAVGSEISHVFGGPADRGLFGETAGFALQRVPERPSDGPRMRRHLFFQELCALRQLANEGVPEANQALEHKFTALLNRFLTDTEMHWLHGVELLEVSFVLKLGDASRAELLRELNADRFASHAARECIADGIHLAKILAT